MSQRFRIQAFYPSVSSGQRVSAAFISADGGLRETITFKAALKAAEELSETFPACIHFTITRGDFK
jgi:hypothetical protein